MEYRDTQHVYVMIATAISVQSCGVLCPRDLGQRPSRFPIKTIQLFDGPCECWVRPRLSALFPNLVSAPSQFVDTCSLESYGPSSSKPLILRTFPIGISALSFSS